MDDFHIKRLFKYTLRIFNYMVKLIIIDHLQLSPKHACIFLFHSPPREGMIFVSRKLNMIFSIHSLNQEVLEYPQKFASILHVQKIYQARPANSTGRDYLVPVQFDLVDTYFYSR